MGGNNDPWSGWPRSHARNQRLISSLPTAARIFQLLAICRPRPSHEQQTFPYASTPHASDMGVLASWQEGLLAIRSCTQWSWFLPQCSRITTGEKQAAALLLSLRREEAIKMPHLAHLKRIFCHSCQSRQPEAKESGVARQSS